MNLISLHLPRSTDVVANMETLVATLQQIEEDDDIPLPFCPASELTREDCACDMKNWGMLQQVATAVLLNVNGSPKSLAMDEFRSKGFGIRKTGGFWWVQTSKGCIRFTTAKEY